ncbi:MAG: hypothetical protein J6P60_06775, partial [Lachnospiraceae bacterium]|nr:hypothetical protein [Lachnospiraceae bacterium]
MRDEKNMCRYEDAKENIRRHLMGRIDLSREMKDEEIRRLIDEEIVLVGRYGYLSLMEKNRLGKELFYAIRKLDILQEL